MKRLLLLCFAACAAKPLPPPVVPKAPDPELVLLNHTLEPGLCQARMRMHFSLTNPRSVPLRLGAYEATITRDGVAQPVQRGELGLVLLASDEATFDIAVVLGRGGCRGPPSAGNDERVSVAGHIMANAGDEVIFEFEDAETLPGERALEVDARLRGQRYDFGRVELYAVLQLYNPNGFALAVDELNYTIKMGGHVVAQGTTLEHERLRDLARATRELALDIDAADPAIATLQQLGKVPYQIEATLRVGGQTRISTASGEFSF